MNYEEKRTEFLNTLHPGDFVSWTTFDGSSVYEVELVTDTQIILKSEHGSNKSIWPRSGKVHRDYYGGFDEKLGPPSDTAVEYFLRRRHRRNLEPLMTNMTADQLERTLVSVLDILGSP